MKNALLSYCVAGLAFALSFLLSSTPRAVPVQNAPEEREDHAAEMFDWWYSQRAAPFDLIPQGAFQKAALYAKTKMRQEGRAPYSESATAPWVSLGPNNVGGRTLAIAVDPVNTNVVWAGAASGGLWKSTTGGVGATAWSFISTGFPSLSVSAIAINPENTNILYIGTGEIGPYHGAVNGTPGARASYGMGILKTTDGGATWNQTSLTWTFQQITGVQKIAINPLNPKTLYAATSEGLFKSTDAGTSWAVSDPTLLVMDVAINPADTSMLYATHGNLNSSTNTGLFQTLDAGGEWLPLTNGIPSADFGRAAISICTSHPSTVYLGIANAVTQRAALYRSDDDGGSWNPVSDSNFTGSQGWYDIAVGAKPNDQFTVFSSGLDIYRSMTGGTDPVQQTYWFQGSMGRIPPGGQEGPSSYAHADHHAITFDPVHPDTAYFGTDGGVFKTTDGGETFFGCNGGYVTTQFYNGFANALTDSLIALGGLQDNGVLKYEGSTTWNKVDGGDGGWCAIDPTDKNILYDEYVYLALKKSLSGGPFESIVSGLPTGPSVSNFIAPFVISPSNGNILYAGNKNVYKTTSGGDSWFAPNGGANLNGSRVASIGISYTSSDTLMAATGSPSFQEFSSTNGGQSWTNVTGSLPTRYPTDIEFDPTNSANVYVTFSGYGTPHVFKSPDLGQSWYNITSNLPDIPHQSIAVDPAQPQNIYVGTDLGVFHSSDGGTDWEDYNSGMVPAMILDLGVSRTKGTLRAATFGNGVFERKLARGTASLSLVAPNGGEVLLAGQPSLIRWSEVLMGPLTIEYSTDDGGTWNLIANNVTASAGQYSWGVPLVSTTQARIRISGSGAPAVSSTGPFSITLTPDVLDGWNLTSLRLLPANPRRVALFPSATSPAFGYTSSYVARDSLLPGSGYWLRFSGPQLTPYSGDSILTDTVLVASGWNLIGSLSNTIPVSGIVQLPPGNVASHYFGYTGSYFSSASLEPGKGYWVKVNSSGKLVLRSGSAAAAPIAVLGEETGSWSPLTISDAGGRSQIVYLARWQNRTGSDQYPLPPLPPEGAFDARFTSGSLVEYPDKPSGRDVQLLISTTRYPVNIAWDLRAGLDGAILVLDDHEITMAGSGRATISGPQTRVSIRAAERVTQALDFSLEQNYPNPFNPKTTIPFVLSRPSIVTLKVYDIAGQEIATLLNRRLMGTGRHQPEFDASSQASGVYFYRLMAETSGKGDGETFVSVRKMLLAR